MLTALQSTAANPLIVGGVAPTGVVLVPQKSLKPPSLLVAGQETQQGWHSALVSRCENILQQINSITADILSSLFQ